jgi:two-component system, NtrC family, nitrogen regulation response regulator NtrX
VVCDNATRAISLLRNDRFDIVFSDVVMPGKDGLSMLADLREIGITTPVIMISGQATVDMAVRATRLGAVDFLEKPISSDKLLLTVENALRLVRLEEENRQLRDRVGRHEIVWASDAMRQVMAQVDRVAPAESRVCVLGETGTGKELVARAIHERSARRDRPFVTVNCAAVPSELIESELFGHEKGAFTGAAGRHLGKFEQAHGGTLFLDEIGDMPPAMQAKLLRLLQEGELERIGGDRPITVNTRVVVATHRDLESLVAKGAFREDLYHRIFVFPIVMPALRERPEDIPLLTAHFAKVVADQNGWKPRPFTPEAIEQLARYGWPGNVREFEGRRSRNRGRNARRSGHRLRTRGRSCGADRAWLPRGRDGEGVGPRTQSSLQEVSAARYRSEGAACADLVSAKSALTPGAMNRTLAVILVAENTTLRIFFRYTFARRVAVDTVAFAVMISLPAR